MNISLLRRVGFVCLAFVVITVLILLTPAARIAAYSSGVLDACINPGNGMMRLVDSSAACHANESFVEWNITGPAGPPGAPGGTGPAGPTGPPGPPGASAGGPPFTWVCTPANYDLGGSGNNSDINVFNGSATPANIAVHFLSKDGTNISGQPIPGSSPVVNYPGQTGSTTVTLAPLNTMILFYLTGSGVRDANPSTLLATVVVTSDQPVVVGYNIPFGALQATPCSLLPK